MRTLVFGKSGQVARALAEIAQRDRLAMTFVPRAQADLTDAAACTALIHASDVDVVINAAAYTAVDRAEQEASTAHAVNATAPGAMAVAAAAKGVPFVHISTDYVFDGQGDVPRQVSDPVTPQSVYGTTKLAGEEAVRAAEGVHAIIRTSWVFSATGTNFLKTMLRLGTERDQLSIVGDQIGGPTPADAIAQMLIDVAHGLCAGKGGGTYHFAGAADISWAGFAAEIFAQANMDVAIKEISTSEYPTPAVRPLNSVLDCTKLEADFGISCPDWRSGITRALAAL
jgi:dTDP-4-dehydrorhamnose reductase